MLVFFARIVETIKKRWIYARCCSKMTSYKEKKCESIYTFCCISKYYYPCSKCPYKNKE